MACIFSVILILAALGGLNAQSDEETDCSKMDFTSLPKTCCKKPFGQVFVPDKMDSSPKNCKGSSKMMDWLNSYKINSVQQKDLKNFINETDKNTLKTFCEAGAYAECVFVKNKWVNESGVINVGSLSDYIQGIGPDSAWKSMIHKILNPMDQESSTSYKFTDIVEDRFEKATCSSGSVNLLPLMMVQMLQSELIWMCPEQAVYSSKNKCMETMKNYKYCDGKIYSTLAKGIFFFPYV